MEILAMLIIIYIYHAFVYAVTHVGGEYSHYRSLALSADVSFLLYASGFHFQFRLFKTTHPHVAPFLLKHTASNTTDTFYILVQFTLAMNSAKEIIDWFYKIRMV